MLHILLLPLAWASHVGAWIDGHVLSPFQVNETATQVTEEEIGCYGVLSFLLYKVSRLIVDALPLFELAWLFGRVARGVALAVALLVSAWLITCAYIGTLIPILDLQVSYGGLLLAPVVAWITLAYVLLADRVRNRRMALEAQAETED